MKKMGKIEAFFRAMFDVHDIYNGTTCEVSKVLNLDMHDFGVKNGGDGVPSHFHVYVCPKCGSRFTI